MKAMLPITNLIDEIALICIMDSGNCTCRHATYIYIHMQVVIYLYIHTDMNKYLNVITFRINQFIIVIVSFNKNFRPGQFALLVGRCVMTCKVMSGWVPTYDNAPSRQLHSLPYWVQQANGTGSQFATQS